MSTDNEKLFSMVGRMHVILRREQGRIIDVEWVSTNSEYALEVQRIARASDNQELKELSEQIGILHPLLKESAKQPAAKKETGTKPADAGGTAKYTFSIR
jgi:hypothetical protein